MSQLTTRNVGSEPGTTKKVPKLSIYDLSYDIKASLCDVLGEESFEGKNENLWLEISERMQVGKDSLQEMKRRYRGQTRLDEVFKDVLLILGNLDRNVKELFVVLSDLKQFKAMRIIQHLVDEKYHKLFNRENQKTAKYQENINSGPNISSLLNVPSESDYDIPAVINESSSVVSSSIESSIDEVSSKVEANDIMKAIPEIKYDELSIATNNWDPNAVLGRGGFGTVFKGYWKNTKVAIKRIEPRHSSSKTDYKTELKQSMNEVRFLILCRHDNVLPLYGYSMSGVKPCLVYKLMEGGTLEQRLYSEHSLTWQMKHNISVGTARGIQFLHTYGEKPLIHGDIKPANILLDICGMPKLGDFGLARESPSKDPVEISKVYGTRPYLPQEFIFSRCLSTKIDTFSFGIVLYELATRKKVVVNGRQPQHLIDLMNLYFQQKKHYLHVIDTTYLSEDNQVCEFGASIFPLLTCLGQLCTQQDPDKRPDAVEVLRRLEGR